MRHHLLLDRVQRVLGAVAQPQVRISHHGLIICANLDQNELKCGAYKKIRTTGKHLHHWLRHHFTQRLAGVLVAAPAHPGVALQNVEISILGAVQSDINPALGF